MLIAEVANDEEKQQRDDEVVALDALYTACLNRAITPLQH
jgi:hypothetical protein